MSEVEPTEPVAGPAAIEKEVVVLRTALDMIGAMVNRSIFDEVITSRDTNLTFNHSPSAALFNILLADFLSQPGGPFFAPAAESTGRKSDLTFLVHIRRVTANPQLGLDGHHLRRAVDAFADWLDVEADIPEVHLGDIDLHIPMTIRRITYLKITGDIAKHSVGKLNDVVRRIRKLMKDNDHPITLAQGVAVISDFQEQFFEDILYYHASTIAWHLNEIRWEIWSYLQPERDRAFEPIDPEPMYKWKLPDGLTDPIAVRMHWDLMNVVMRPPAFPRFGVTPFLQLRY